MRLTRRGVVRRRSRRSSAAGLRGADFGGFMATERRRWGEVVRDAKITLKE